jgi:hypothetical protein
MVWLQSLSSPSYSTTPEESTVDVLMDLILHLVIAQAFTREKLEHLCSVVVGVSVK